MSGGWGGGGGASVPSGQWEVAYARRMINTDGNDAGDVETGVLMDRRYEHACAIFVGAGAEPISSSTIQLLVYTDWAVPASPNDLLATMGYSPDAGVTTYDMIGGYIREGFSFDASDYFTGLLHATTAGGSSISTANADKEFVVHWDDTGNFGYFVIARRQVMS